jgi:hypothetical protein
MEQVECRKCKRSEILYVSERKKDGSKTEQTFVSSGLVRCNRHGRAYVSRDTKIACASFEPRRT